ncbi:MAG: RNA-binding domain-containing protein [Anaerolineales bacterium]
MDLHLHTPASSDYQEPKATYLDVLHTAEARGLDIMAFADHNTVGGLRRLRDEISELELLERLNRLQPEERERLNEYRRLLDKILLLPGFEFTATFGFHILGIFPPETSIRELEHLLLSLDVPKDQLDAGSVTVGPTTDVLTAYKLISEAGGIAIAAHANSTNGVAMRGFGFGGQTKIAFTQDPHLCALEVTDLDQKGRRTSAAFFSGSKPEYPRRMHCVTGSDAHRLARDPKNSKNLGIGDRATDVFIEEASFEALRDLFKGSDFARVRPHVGKGVVQTAFDYVQQAREEGPNIVQAFHDSMSQRGGKLYNVVSDVCAMANTNGGTIYVGIGPDAKQPIVGVPDHERSVKELRSTITRMLTPQLGVTVDLHDTQGKKIIRVLVPRGDDTPYAIDDNKIYVREEAETSLAVRDEIVQLVLRGQGGEAAPEKLPAAAAAAEPAAAPVAHPAALSQAPTPAGVAAAPAVPAVVEPVTGAVTPPRTGVEIVATDERDGSRYHTMRDLRNGSVVKNVTRSSARKLWHYAISAKESGALNPDHVSWQGDVGLWRKTHKGGATRYDLVQRGEGELRVFYGVTEDGIHGVWRRMLEAEERRTAQIPTVGVPANGQPVTADVYAGELAPGPEFAAVEPSSAPPAEVDALPTPALLLAEDEAVEGIVAPQMALDEALAGDKPAAEAEPAPKRRRSSKKAAAKSAGGRSTRKSSRPAATKTAAKTSSRKRAKPAAGSAA